jgi:hypothetical protein
MTATRSHQGQLVTAVALSVYSALLAIQRSQAQRNAGMPGLLTGTIGISNIFQLPRHSTG